MSSGDHIGQTRALSCDMVEHGVVLETPRATLVGAFAGADLLSAIDIDPACGSVRALFGDCLRESLECKAI